MSRIWAVTVILSALALGACSDSGRIFGFERGGPDEFTVVRNQPLSMPPNATLRPPQPGSTRSERDFSSNQARQELLTSAPEEQAALNGAGARQYSSLTGRSRGEVALVQRVQSYYGVDPEIRRVVDSESRHLAMEEGSWVDSLMFWNDPREPGAVLDAPAESRRLRENEALGKPANAGVAPVIVRKKSGIISLF